MTQLGLAIPGGILVGLIVFAVVALGGWAAGIVAGLNLGFHSGVSPLWFVGFLALQLASGIAASASAARFYRRQSWLFVWVDLAMVALVPGVIVGVVSNWK